MFVNTNFEDIFIINTKTGEIHAASKLTGSCNVDGDYVVTPTKDVANQIEAYKSVIKQGFSLDFCGHCFPGLSKR